MAASLRPGCEALLVMSLVMRHRADSMHATAFGDWSAQVAADLRTLELLEREVAFARTSADVVEAVVRSLDSAVKRYEPAREALARAQAFRRRLATPELVKA